MLNTILIILTFGYVFYTAMVVFIVISENPNKTRGWVYLSIFPLILLAGLFMVLFKFLQKLFYKD